ncbi:SMP-30/gluconolactonase/LRE family protein [Neorhizobium tomejilense]|uniref:SMP-30/gluconolactonase/LRE family protein n=1 Tax=Neorhizobium tomejilense TaxID=2093828 RepID=UPI003ED0C9B4
MRIDRPEVEHIIDFPIGAGEGPLWSADEGALYFIDIRGPALFRLSLGDRQLNHWQMPSTIGGFGLCLDDRIIVALRNGVHFFDPKSGEFEFICHPEKDRPTNRLNDAKVSPDGRFFVGSMDTRNPKEPVASLFRIDPDGSVNRVLDELLVSNGLAWSPDGRTMYHSDSRGCYVQTFDYDLGSGGISNRRQLIQLDDADGRPDGAACDIDGFYWSAGVTAGCLNRIAPDGRLDRKIILPIPAPSMPCFGGPDLKTMFVTSLTLGDSPGVAGTVIAFPVDVPGAPIAKFGLQSSRGPEPQAV